MTAPSGEQLRLALGDQEAVVTEVGASLRSYRVGGRDVIAGYPEDSVASGGRGQVLAPWPNRLEDGSYTWEGVSGRAALDEPERRNAIHGIVRWLRWRVVDRGESWVVLSCPLAPQPAYPFELALSLRYELHPAGRWMGGVTVRVEAAAAGATAVPFGIGFHPYIDLPGGADEAFLVIPAERRVLLDERGLPVGDEPIEGTTKDFRRGAWVRRAVLDDCFARLERRPVSGGGTPFPPGWARAECRGVVAPGGGAIVWVDPGFDYLMCYTGDTLSDPAARRRSIAIEPMTCPPNAFRSGDGLIRLEPGELWRGSWGIVPV